jgi:hypothetical protein
MSDEGQTFTFGGKEYPVVAPKGRKGRKATAWLMNQFGSGEEADSSAFLDVFEGDELDEHLPTLLGLPDNVIEEEGDLGEMFTAVMAVVSVVTSKMSAPEVDAAAKNS